MDEKGLLIVFFLFGNKGFGAFHVLLCDFKLFTSPSKQEALLAQRLIADNGLRQKVCLVMV